MREPHDHPPRSIRRVFRRLFRGRRGEEILEDLDREYAAVRERHRRAVAWGWYLVQLLRPDTWRLARALRRFREADGDLGPAFTVDAIEAVLKGTGADYRRLEREALLVEVAGALAAGRIVGWFSGRMEFGPRALGARSILGDPRDPRMQSRMNLKIKFRESFRPFAPSVLRERVSDYFELDRESPYMLLVAPVRDSRRIALTEAEKTLWGIDRLNVPRSDIPAVTHVDYSARIHTVDRETNPDYYDLIRAFEALTGCGVLVNTSFNVRGEPIVCTPEDAYRCYMRTDIDMLVVGPFVLEKTRQPMWREDRDWRLEFQLD